LRTHTSCRFLKRARCLRAPTRRTLVRAYHSTFAGVPTHALALCTFPTPLACSGKPVSPCTLACFLHSLIRLALKLALHVQLSAHVGFSARLQQSATVSTATVTAHTGAHICFFTFSDALMRFMPSARGAVAGHCSATQERHSMSPPLTHRCSHSSHASPSTTRSSLCHKHCASATRTLPVPHGLGRTYTQHTHTQTPIHSFFCEYGKYY
jgi:hypothetical protein